MMGFGFAQWKTFAYWLVPPSICTMLSRLVPAPTNHRRPFVNHGNISYSAFNSFTLARLAARSARVSVPWIVLAAAQRFRPSVEVGPVDFPPCHLQVRFPLAAASPHWTFVLLDLAWQRGASTRPLKIKTVFSMRLIIRLSHCLYGINWVRSILNMQNCFKPKIGL